MFKRKLLSMVLLAGMLLGQSVPYAHAAVCDQAQFVSDITVPDGTSFAPGTAFTKTWRFTNTGTCTWTTSYRLVFVGGDMMGNTVSVPLPVDVPPGQMLDISVNLTAPATTGHYKSQWKFVNASGGQFSIGDSGNNAFWVDINVVTTDAVIYDFVANAPYASWRSGAGYLPYPGTSGDWRGFSYQVDRPHLEDDSFDSLPGLLVVPQNKYNGYIQATYPEFEVQQGDKLQTLVNCEFGATGCYVTFRIDYLLPSGAQKKLWQWKEANDKRFYRANIDLSSLAGQKVRFVFMLLSTGFASKDRAIWGSPRIIRTGTIQPPAPPATLTPLPALTPSQTPFVPPPPTIASSGCDHATFVTDVNVPDGTNFAPGESFSKTWRIKNTGACAWTRDYKLMYYSGEQMGAPTSINIPLNVFYGETVDLTVNMVAPNAAGSYRGFWILSNANGTLFGIGADASKPFWVEINVTGDSPIPLGYDFTANACSAQWKSGAGYLPCPGTDGDSKGFVLIQNAPKLEDGSTGVPGLLTFPQFKYNGYIQGYYPTFTVQPGDRFQTAVGCEYGSSCYVTFMLQYMTPNGGIFNFWTWREQNQGKYNNIDIDLAPLAGRSVRFILTLLATGYASNDRVIWSGPRIVRERGTLPTATAIPPTSTPLSPTPTATPSTGNWLTYTNTTYGFKFKYPPQAQITDQQINFVRVNLPIQPGTNLSEKYLETVVTESASTCESPFASSSILATSETVDINGISFLKQTGGDAGTGQFHDWVAYSTYRNNNCISIGFVLHSTNPGNYDPPIPVYDKTAESVVFEQIMQTLSWIAPTPTSTPNSLIGPYAVIRVANDDVLNIRQLAGASYPVVGSFPSDAINVMRTGPIAGEPNGTEWMEVQNPSGGIGWVNAFYLTEYVSHDTFCADTRIAPLLEKLKTSMNQSDGLLLSQQVSPAHGMNVHLWAYQQPVHYTPEQAVGAFVSTNIYNWGSGPRGEPDYGTFKEIIQPRMLDTLNAPNMETYCDSLDKVYPLARPWPYPGIRYYNLYKPGTPGTELDFRTWLIGIEYYQGEPYIYGMVNIVWEP